MQIDDPAAASVFDRLLLAVQSGFKTLFPRPRDHDWSADEAEWATDVMLTSIHSLSAVYPDLVKHAVTQFDTVDVMRAVQNIFHAGAGLQEAV